MADRGSLPDRADMEVQETLVLVYCHYCHKTHSVSLDEEPCAPDAWVLPGEPWPGDGR